MYSFDPTEEQRMLVDVVHKFAQTDLRPASREAEEECILPAEIIEKGWQLGILQASIPAGYGGFGERSAVTSVLAAEELAFGDLAGALAVLTPGLYALPILISGSESQKEQLLPPVVEASWQPFTAAWIEPRFDFDPNDLSTEAQPDGDGYILNGVKAFVPYADTAAGMLVFARLERRTQGFLLRNGASGVTIQEREQLLGINALPLFRVSLQGVRVPASDRLGGPDGASIEPVLAGAQTATAALAVGLARAALEYARDYAREREVFGTKIAQKQSIAFMIAEMATEIEAVRLMTWEAAWMLDQHRDEASRHAYLALSGAMDMAMMVSDRAVQILGGHGFIRDHPVELWMRNGRGIASLTGLAVV